MNPVLVGEADELNIYMIVEHLIQCARMTSMRSLINPGQRSSIPTGCNDRAAALWAADAPILTYVKDVVQVHERDVYNHVRVQARLLSKISQEFKLWHFVKKMASMVGNMKWTLNRAGISIATSARPSEVRSRSSSWHIVTLEIEC